MFLLALLAACQTETDAGWLQAYGYGWNGYNHRLSELIVRPEGPDQVALALIGGTSTTAFVFEDPACASPLRCDELPLLDTSRVDVRWSHGHSAEIVLGSALSTLTVGRDGASTTLSVPLPRRRAGRLLRPPPRLEPHRAGGAARRPRPL